LSFCDGGTLLTDALKAGGSMSAADLYETNATAWAEAQADALRRRATNEIDWNNVAEEIEDVAQRNRDRIEGALTTALVHLLQFQQDARSNAWKAMVVSERNRVARLIRRNPSLAGYPAAVLADVYPDACALAEAETALTGLPVSCPWTIEQVLDQKFGPGPVE
jgi:hypothetical protein